jgi:hypothetical protein
VFDVSEVIEACFSSRFPEETAELLALVKKSSRQGGQEILLPPPTGSPSSGSTRGSRKASTVSCSQDKFPWHLEKQALARQETVKNKALK